MPIKRNGPFGGAYGVWWRGDVLQIAVNERGNEFAFNLQLLWGIIPIGYYAAVRVWNSRWWRSYNLSSRGNK